MKAKLKAAALFAAKVLVWLLLLALCALPAVFMNSVYGYFPLLLLFFLLAASLGSLLLMKKKVTVESGGSDIVCRRGQTAEIGLKLINASPFTCAKAGAVMRISDLFGGTDARSNIPFTAAARETVDFGFGLDMNHVGLYAVSMEEVKLYDAFGIFSCCLPLQGSYQAAVLPVIRTMSDLHMVEDVSAETDTDTRFTVVGGTDYTGVREYVPGDPMKQIHWKLSAHSRNYLTKQQESSRRQEFAVVLDFAARPCADREELMEINDCLIETALAVANQVRRTDSTCALLYAARDGSVVRTMRTGEDDLPDLIRSFAVITEEPGEDFPDACRILQQESERQNRSTNLIVVTARVTPGLLEELEAAKHQRRAPELYVAVPAAWTSREVENETAPLRELDEAGVPYTLVRTDPVIRIEDEVEETP